MRWDTTPYAKAQTHYAEKKADCHHFHAENQRPKTGVGPWLSSPLAELRQFNVQESELPYLPADQIHHLLSELQKGINVMPQWSQGSAWQQLRAGAKLNRPAFPRRFQNSLNSKPPSLND